MNTSFLSLSAASVLFSDSFDQLASFHLSQSERIEKLTCSARGHFQLPDVQNPLKLQPFHSGRLFEGIVLHPSVRMQGLRSRAGGWFTRTQCERKEILQRFVFSPWWSCTWQSWSPRSLAWWCRRGRIFSRSSFQFPRVAATEPNRQSRPLTPEPN